MLCAEFEDRLTDYLDGSLDAAANSAFAEHALRCPVCHELLSEVKNTLQACRMSQAPKLQAAGLEARILMRTMPNSGMTCEEFEDYLTDYLDVLPERRARRLTRSECRLARDLCG